MNQEVFRRVKNLADLYAFELRRQVALREREMQKDDLSHHLLYRVLGVAEEEGRLID